MLILEVQIVEIVPLSAQRNEEASKGLELIGRKRTNRRILALATSNTES